MLSFLFIAYYNSPFLFNLVFEKHNKLRQASGHKPSTWAGVGDGSRQGILCLKITWVTHQDRDLKNSEGYRREERDRKGGWEVKKEPLSSSGKAQLNLKMPCSVLAVILVRFPDHDTSHIAKISIPERIAGLLLRHPAPLSSPSLLPTL